MTRPRSTNKKPSAKPESNSVRRPRFSLRAALDGLDRKSALLRIQKNIRRLPAGFLVKGKSFASLDHVLDPSVPTRSGMDLSIFELQKLTMRRFRSDPYFVPLCVLGVEGTITRNRALREVKALSPLGRHLISVDQAYIAATLAQRRKS